MPTIVVKLSNVYITSSLWVLLIYLIDSSSVEQWGQYELSMHGPSDKNPFVDYYVNANFTLNSNPNVLFKVNGFYDGNGMYRIRFMPNKIGTWSYHTISNVNT
eukprot:53009_1